MVFNATFNNISAISWGSVLLVAETGLSVNQSVKTSGPNYFDPVLIKTKSAIFDFIFTNIMLLTPNNTTFEQKS